MWNTLRVLLHRPLLEDGNLQLEFPAASKSSLAACSEAATKIVEIVRLYDKAFSIKRAPYLISYATYVAATIHVRIAATRKTTSEAHECLRTCFFVFKQNSGTNYAVRKAIFVLETLCKRMDIAIPDQDVSNGSSSDDNNVVNDPNPRGSPQASVARLADNAPDQAQPTTEWPTMVEGQFVPDLDVDAIIQSFMHDQQMRTSAFGVAPLTDFAGNPLSNQAVTSTRPEMFGNGVYSTLDDTLFGFNASAFDWMYPNTATF